MQILSLREVVCPFLGRSQNTKGYRNITKDKVLYDDIHVIYAIYHIWYHGITAGIRNKTSDPP